MLKHLLNSFLDLIYRKKCYFCGKSHESVRMCSSCYDELEFLPTQSFRYILKSPIYCAGVYDKNLQKLIRGLKYHKQKELAYYQAKFMNEFWQKLDLGNNFQVIPVPIFEKRKKQRKYNHMELIAEEFCTLAGLELNTDCIKRIKDTKPQYKLNKSQRMINLSNAFKVDKIKIKQDKRILIIDDICTTGSTFEEMIKEFNKNGIYDITCFATTTPFEK